MTGLRSIITAERTPSVREAASRYQVGTARELIAAYGNRTAYRYRGLLVERSGSSIGITLQNGDFTKLEVSDKKISPAQRDQVLEKAWDETTAFIRDHWEAIEAGHIKAVDIGGALYGIAAGAILIIFAPFAALGPLGAIAGKPFVWAAQQKGRYLGAAVDEVVKVLKGESDALKMQELAGVLTTFSLFSTVPTVAELFGSDGWNLTVSVGKEIGGAVSDAVTFIVETVGGPILDIPRNLLDAIF